jgi:uncharacterized protein (DUF362 family)
MNRKPVIEVFDLAEGHVPAVTMGLERTGFFRDVPAGGTVFLKPNLTFPVFKPGVMTSYACLEAVVRCLRARGYQVIIGEADGGGYNRFAMDQVFENMGISQLARETGARIVNLSFCEPETLRIQAARRELQVVFPKLLLREIDAFITLPVPKIHMNSLVSMSIKNQWGCIQVPAERLKLHPYLAEVMYEFNRRLPNAYSIIDGRYGLNRSGPMRGDVVEPNWLLAANDLVAADRVCCRLMQVDESRVRYFRHFQRRGWWPAWEEMQLNTDLKPFQRIQFYLRREWTDLPGALCFNSPFFAWLGYHSPLAGFAHWLLYLFREPFYDYAQEKAKVRPPDKPASP